MLWSIQIRISIQNNPKSDFNYLVTSWVLCKKKKLCIHNFSKRHKTNIKKSANLITTKKYQQKKKPILDVKDTVGDSFKRPTNMIMTWCVCAFIFFPMSILLTYFFDLPERFTDPTPITNEPPQNGLKRMNKAEPGSEMGGDEMKTTFCAIYLLYDCSVLAIWY